MAKTVISKRDLDALIRAYLGNLGDECAAVNPMPVVWHARDRECNWAIPGWTGDSEVLSKCMDRLNRQLRDLRRMYDIHDEQ